VRLHKELKNVITVVNTANNNAEEEETYKDHEDEKHDDGHHLRVVFLGPFLPYSTIQHLAPVTRKLCVQLSSFCTRKRKTFGHCILTALPCQRKAGVVAFEGVIWPRPPPVPTITVANLEGLTMVSKADSTSRHHVHVLCLQVQIQVVFVFEHLVAEATRPVLGTTPLALLLLFVVAVQVSLRIKWTPLRPGRNPCP